MRSNEVIDQAPSTSDVVEELLQFLYLAPVGIVKFAADGTVDLINPFASQILLPLVRQANLDNLYVALARVVPDLGKLVAAFVEKSGQILDQQRLETHVGDGTLVLSLIVNRVDDAVYMAVLKDVTKLAEQERRLFADQQDSERFLIMFAIMRFIPSR